MSEFNKYKYLGNVVPTIPNTWNHIILNMLSKIDHLIKPRFIPRFFVNNYDVYKGPIFIRISQKFGTLRIKHEFIDEDIKSIISETQKRCDNTCEYCGKENTSLVTVKNWVRNLCLDCINKYKN